MNKPDFLKEIEENLEIHEEAIKDLEEQGATKEAIDRVKRRRDCLIARLNLLGGPSVREKSKPGCCFVKTGGGWFRGDE